MTTITWTNAIGGAWTLGSNWSSDLSLPGPGDTVVVTTAGTYAITLGTLATIGSLDLSNPNASILLGAAATLAVGGLTVESGTISGSGGTLAVNSGIAEFRNAASLVGLDLAFFGTNNRLDGPYLATLALGPTGTIQVGTGASVMFIPSSGGTIANQGLIVESGTGAVIDLQGAFSNTGTINLSGGASLIQDNIYSTLTNGGTIVFGDAQGTLDLRGTITDAQLGVVTGAPGQLGINGLLDNSGSVLSLGSSATFGTFDLGGTLHGGTVSASGGAVTADGGTLDSVTWLGPLNINGPDPFSSRLSLADGFVVQGPGGTAGTIVLNGGRLDVKPTATLDNVTVHLGGVLSGSVLALGADADIVVTTPSMAGNIEAGTLTNAGTIAVSGGAAVSVFIWGSLGSGTLTSMLNTGTLSVSGAGTGLFVQAETATNSGLFDIAGGATLSVGLAGYNNGGISTQFANTGTIRLEDSASVLVLASTLTTGGLGTLINAGGTISLAAAGRLDNTGATLTLSPSGPFANFVLGGGRIQGGTVVANGAEPVFTGAGGWLAGVNWRGDLDVGGGGAVEVDDSLDIAAIGGGRGTINLSGTNSVLTLNIASLANTTVNLTGAVTLAGVFGLWPVPPAALTLAASTTLAADPALTSLVLAGTIINQGLIDSTAGVMSIGAFTPPPPPFGGFYTPVWPVSFDNMGTLAVAGAVGKVGDLTAFSNEGLIRIENGESFVVQTSTFSNTGSLLVDGGSTLEFSGSVGAVGTIAFGVAGGVLSFDAPGSVAAIVSNWTSNDVVALRGAAGLSLGFNAGVLSVLQGGSQLAAFAVGGGYSAGDFALNTLGGVNTITEGGAACFAHGTRIATAHGERRVEDIAAGDVVVTANGVKRPVVWVGARHIVCRHHPAPDKVWPILVRHGAFPGEVPVRDLLLSPDHAVYIDDVLVPIRCLVNGHGIVRVPLDEVTYYHVELATHDLLLAEGLPTESYLDTGDRWKFANSGGMMRLYPDFSNHGGDVLALWEALGYAPLVVAGPQLAAARRLIGPGASRALSEAEVCAPLR